MKRTASVGAILHGHRPVKFRDRNVFATLLFGIFCVVVFEMMFFVFFSSRERTPGVAKSTGVAVRDEDEQRGGNVFVVKIVLAVDRTNANRAAGGCDDARVGPLVRGETDVRE